MSNLPPAITDNMIPGNRPEDVALDVFTQELDNFLTERGIRFDSMSNDDLDAFDRATEMLFDLLMRYRVEIE